MGKAEKFVGNTYRKGDVKAIVSLIQMTSGKIGVFKRDFKREEQFWAVMKVITGMEPFQDETFMTSVYRIRDTFLAKKPTEKLKIISSIKKTEIQLAMGSYEFSPAIRTPKREIPTAKTVFVGKKTKATSRVAKAAIAPSTEKKQEFYKSWEWRTLRIKVLNEFGARCLCCGATPEHTDMTGKPVKIVVDHIKSLHKHWDLRLKRSNLQVLCEECNQGKGAWDETDHRPKRGPDEWIVEDDIPTELRDQLQIRH